MRTRAEDIGAASLRRSVPGFWLFALLVSLATISGPASAATPSVATGNVNMRAGPSTGYPVITVVPVGASIVTYGCVNTFDWCDVSYGTARGWVSSGYITARVNSSVVTVTAATAPRIGITVVGFSKTYWDTYYTAYPWYGRWTVYRPYYRAYPGPPPPPTVVHRTATGSCSGGACRGATQVTGSNGGSVTRAGSCGNGHCGGARVVEGPGGRTAVAAGGCAKGVGCGSVRVGPNGGTVRHGVVR
ncbi:hypothetical protein DLJ53_06345 [Acuticoccus sediminis]|uniref:SH3b domain-containing protein n=1 Tax=Acuticoccus sediminis TaxID=2184697 RepID=A0A8B2NZ09_9HYPH|nr:SH3 domain-containing protein [Acuticoccus sediminis]RAI04071.1 hypothetical protein DLJ53_06345 [Acuticoccus sediminis]